MYTSKHADRFFIFFLLGILNASFVLGVTEDEVALDKLRALRQEINQEKKQPENSTLSSELKKLLDKKRLQARSSLLSSNSDSMEMLSEARNGSEETQNDKNELRLQKLKEAKEAEQERRMQLENALAERSFQELLKKMMPLTPEQIRRLRTKQERVDVASKGPVGIPPKPVAISHFVSLAPGDKLPVIRMQQGFVSSLVFVDSTGAPWPIELYSLGDTNLFNVSWDKKSNILLVQANNKFDYGNLAVKLVGQNTPVMLTLTPGQREVDYRADLRIQGVGPNALPIDVSDGLPSKANDLLLTILNGVPPQNAKTLHVSGGNAQAWLINSKIYLRTRMTLVSPGWLSSMSSPDGMNVYEVVRAPVLLVSKRVPNKNGQIVPLKLEGI